MYVCPCGRRDKWRELEKVGGREGKGTENDDFFGRNDAEAETPVLWPPHVKS